MRGAELQYTLPLPRRRPHHQDCSVMQETELQDTITNHTSRIAK